MTFYSECIMFSSANRGLPQFLRTLPTLICMHDGKFPVKPVDVLPKRSVLFVVPLNTETLNYELEEIKHLVNI